MAGGRRHLPVAGAFIAPLRAKNISNYAQRSRHNFYQRAYIFLQEIFALLFVVFKVEGGNNSGKPRHRL